MIAGCLVAEQTSKGYQMLTVEANEADMCSERCYPVKCGVAKIWVSQNFRKMGIATALMNALKKNFFFGYTLSNGDIAFSSPTEMGKAFAKKYFTTSNFMIYFAWDITFLVILFFSFCQSLFLISRTNSFYLSSFHFAWHTKLIGFLVANSFCIVFLCSQAIL